jgi:hypothetical protein
VTPRLGRVLLTLAGAFALCSGEVVGGPVWAQSTAGTWSHFPAQTPVFTAVVRPPIKANGTSVFNDGSVIAVKFKLMTGSGVFLFESVWSNNFPEEGESILDDDYAALTFAPAGSLTFNDITNLTADYAFTMGNCQGGSLRWSVTFDLVGDNPFPPGEGEPDPRSNDQSVFIYYGGHPNFTDCTTGADNQSGVNMIGLSDLRYDTSQVGGTFYDTYANAQTLVGTEPVVGVTLVVDSGWMQDEFGAYKDQSVALTSAQVNDNVFVPVTGEPTSTCTLPPAAITVVEDINGPADPATAQFRLNDSFFGNTNQCTYTYNLVTSSLFGPGHYSVYVVIDNQAIQNPGQFTLE